MSVHAARTELPSPYIILGPSTIGKSALARAMASETGAHTITADKYYLYAGKIFMLGIGLTPDNMREDPLPRLRGSLAPEDPLPSPEAYVDLAETEVDKIHSLGGLALIEGCSVSYGKALLERYGRSHTRRFTWWRDYHINVHLGIEIEEAYRKLLDLGLYDETERNLDLGYENTYPMSSLIYRPTILALRGEITKDDAGELVITNWINEATRANRAFARMGLWQPVIPWS